MQRRGPPRLTGSALRALLLAALPFLIQLPAIAGWVTADPILWMSHLATAPPHSLLPGRPGWLDGNAGITLESLGRLAASDWLRGRVPWWDPDAGIGMPLAAELQNGALFLPFVLLLALPHGLSVLKASLQAVAGLAALALFRQIGVRPAIALTCALMFEFGGSFAWFAHGPMLPVAFLPMLLLGIERCRPHEGGRLAPLIVGGAIAFSITAGFPETAFLDGLTALVYAVARAIECPSPRDALRFATRVAGGGVLGLLFAAPAIVAFLDYLPVADLGQNADLAAHRLLAPNAALILFPYLYGTVQFGEAVTGRAEELWWHVGGYLGPIAPFLALCVGRRRRVLAFVLGLWCVATACAAAGVPEAVRAFDLVPFLRNTMIDTWIVPSWEMVALILAALALEDWARGEAALRLGLPVGFFAAATCLAFWLARDELRFVDALAGYRRIAIPTTIVSLACLATVASCLRGAARPARLGVLLAAAQLWTVLALALPLPAPATDRPLATGVVSFLRRNLGWQRFFALDVMAPNYASSFGIAAVNYSAVPDPRLWTGFIRSHLSPAMVTSAEGYRLTPRAPDEIAAELADHVTVARSMRVLASLGVRYVLSPRDEDPFADLRGPGIVPGDARPVAIGPDGARLAITAPDLSDTVIRGVDAFVGTYEGRADGTVVASVCTEAGCARGTLAVRTLADNAFARIALVTPLRIGADGRVTVRLAQIDETQPIALYHWPRAASPATDAPGIAIRTAPRHPPPVLYEDALVAVRPVADAAPYMDDPTGSCIVTVLDRRTARASCPKPGVLVRRELVFPGWHASIDRRATRIRSFDRIFQSVALPAGPSVIRFNYRPPFILDAECAFVLAALVSASLLARVGFSPARRRP